MNGKTLIPVYAIKALWTRLWPCGKCVLWVNLVFSIFLLLSHDTIYLVNKHHKACCEFDSVISDSFFCLKEKTKQSPHLKRKWNWDVSPEIDWNTIKFIGFFSFFNFLIHFSIFFLSQTIPLIKSMTKCVCKRKCNWSTKRQHNVAIVKTSLSICICLYITNSYNIVRSIQILFPLNCIFCVCKKIVLKSQHLSFF